jgi:thiamine kinase-like enzyme
MSEEDDARGRLAALPGFTPERAGGARLTRLPGLTNRVFKVEAGGEPLCLRVPGEGSEAIVDRRAEAINARAAAEAGVAPEIIHFGADGTMLTRFIEGAPLTPEHLKQSPGALQRTAAALRTLHDSAAAFSGEFRAFETMQLYITLLVTLGAPLPDRFGETVDGSEALEAALAAHPAALRPCHCDPTGRNILDTGERVWLVDFEYAAMNDPAWDLAYFSVESDLADEADLTLLAAYLGRPPENTERARFAVTKIVCELLSALWALVQQAQGNRIADFSADAERTFVSASARIRDPLFPAQLEALRSG